LGQRPWMIVTLIKIITMSTPINSILLIDDDQDDKFFFATALQYVDENIQLYTAGNGVDALDKLRFVKPDVILLDLIMPRMNGVVFLNMIKRNKNLRDIPVIIYTTDMSVFQETELLNAGADQIIIKPINLTGTIEKIREILHPSEYQASA
jgi:DNA-binding response OmpR family regulator